MRQTQDLAREHATSRYMCVTVGLIEVLQRGYLSGQDLGPPLSHLDADTAAVIVAESLEADRIWNLPPERLLSGEFSAGKRLYSPPQHSNLQRGVRL